MKIENDKYYTDLELAKYCVNKTKEVIGEENITEYIEPSAGAGAFLNYLPDNTIAYDIEPESNRIIKQDFLKTGLDYKKGRCVVGNPPFGRCNTLSVQFFKYSIKIADYIAFIQPISQLNNNAQMYDFDLIHSENLDKVLYSNKKVHCCFNIYKRPENGLNKKKNYKLKDVTIKEYRKGAKEIDSSQLDYDIGICLWGNVGKVIEYDKQYANELYIKVNKVELREKVINLIKNTDWNEVYKMTTVPTLRQWKVLKYLKEQIPELE